MAYWVCPLICIDVQFFLFLSFSFLALRFFLWRLLLLSLFSLNDLLLLFLNNWPLKNHKLLVRYNLLASPYGQIFNFSQILLYPIQILAHKLILGLWIVSNDYITVSWISNNVFDLRKPILIQINEATTIFYCNILKNQSGIPLN